MLTGTTNHLTAASAADSFCFSVFTFSPHTAKRYFHRSRTDPAEFLIPFSICSFSSLSASSFVCHRDYAFCGSAAIPGDGIEGIAMV